MNQLEKRVGTPVGYEPVEVHHTPAPAPILSIGFNPFLLCPLPLAGLPDSLRQFYRDGVPQYRITSL